MFIRINRFLQIVSSTILLQMLSLFKVNAIVGSKCAFLSGFGLAAPLIGVFGGLRLSAYVLVIRSLFKIMFAISPVNPLLYHIPTFFASAYWTVSGPLIRLCIPALCMILFNLHPVGASAALYSCYWFIPLITSFFAERSVFAKALGSTFTAHAVGSVLWLYWVPMSADMFIALLPVVIIERLFFASGMTLLFYAINGLFHQQKILDLWAKRIFGFRYLAH